MTSGKAPSEEPAHDILAAEEFGVPAPDPGLHHGPVTLPDDPTGIAEPHDVLAAEEFALPAPRGGGAIASGADGQRHSHQALIVAVGALALVLLAKLLRKRRT